MNSILDLQGGPRRRRRTHSDEFKAGAVARCRQPGMSMAAAAMAHGVNANLLRRWVREAEMKPVASALRAMTPGEVQAPEQRSSFVPVQLPATSETAALPDIRIERQRGATAVTVTWPASAASECATWMRELLR
ncbi:transposase [Aquincola tertiaricarbonis]|uniref:Transposase n=1 Tax=Aquincola tertiaricarbonis TaxID=391953 RepID=A0ABY4SGJ8_AQUTE|nr:transposase [Aquincola tertiaricarbonis]URI11634.1 transposase [Aquincola tertiaricarbonis]